MGCGGRGGRGWVLGSIVVTLRATSQPDQERGFGWLSKAVQSEAGLSKAVQSEAGLSKYIYIVL